MVKRFEVYFVDINPTIRSEINQIRPTVIISPDEMNNALNTVIIAPFTRNFDNKNKIIREIPLGRLYAVSYFN